MSKLALKMLINIKKINIGNFFSADEKFPIAEVVRVSNWVEPRILIQSLVVFDSKEFSLSELKAVELTPEWLCAFGFSVIDEESFFKTLNDGRTLEVYFNGFDWLFELSGSHLEKTVKTTSPHVHVLQNLYLEFVGTELKIVVAFEQIKKLANVEKIDEQITKE